MQKLQNFYKVRKRYTECIEKEYRGKTKKKGKNQRKVDTPKSCIFSQVLASLAYNIR